jgi:hypothetical protein
MASAVTVLVLSSLALLARGYALDQSCDSYGHDVVEDIKKGMEEVKWMAGLSRADIVAVEPDGTLKRDGQDNTKARMFSLDSLPHLNRVKGIAQLVYTLFPTNTTT